MTAVNKPNSAAAVGSSDPWTNDRLELLPKMKVWTLQDMDVSKNNGTQNGWFIKENPTCTAIKWMIWGYPYFWKHPYM